MRSKLLFACLAPLTLAAGLLLAPQEAHAEPYTVENQWGGPQARWNPGGSWVIGGRNGQPVVALRISSADGGRTLTGTMTYRGEGPIGFRALNTGGNGYNVENQWGGPRARWNPGGAWVLGGRSGQPVVALDASSPDDGRTLQGSMTYRGEGPIGFRAQLALADQPPMPPPPPPVQPDQPAAPGVVTREAGPIWNNGDANNKCPRVCAPLGWGGVWRTTVPGRMSVCDCQAAPPPPPAGKVTREAGPIWNNGDANNKCPRVCAPTRWTGQWWTTQPGRMSVCECQ